MRVGIMARAVEGRIFVKEEAKATKALCLQHDIEFERCGKSAE